MQINGQLVKKRRKELKMTQNQLADGICKQATISNIEKKNKANSMQIITAICNRLDLDVNEVTITVQTTQVQTNLRKVMLLMQKNQYKKAEQLLNSISDVQETLDDYLLQDFYYCQGAVALFASQNDDLALFNLYKAIDMGAGKNDLTTILSTNLLGVYYSKKQLPDQAKTFFNQAIELINLLPQETLDQRIASTFYNVAKHYSGLKEYQKAIDYCNRGIDICTNSSSLLGLDFLIYEKAFNLYSLDAEQGIKEYEFAKKMAELVHNDYLVSTIEKDLSK
ncbi:hypothetical protein RV11_GL000560 [Enterococcus phoeniculicola]|jgi:tetratricopeptide (TPR) repeat protein|uniref:HTH cro/C1-type domain-containing protein n=1 Tax=Enterococcus phoeniculicola ATCC BAA-412 TaxID=1158610 RepID=R3WEH6_9ENTE|nr:helix-turn-helix transcriptional regulator [Enterococcus phoeniculicola]EOL46281.1 hypothetical protein UC3_01087 [Enterococcus phoeniculicola ATCC BAA-412]EOT76874.1 hypothetical protein I589_01835 [Enterococcus phoeniculicola ATCC BAA-412]OJG71270.1 hypothetical protein RV11_GL000560 [Enterococcus phoeniculicola]